MRRIKIGMVGGGQGSFIGAVRRIDYRFDCVARALSTDSMRALASAKEIGIDPARAYANFAEMAQSES